MYFRLLSLLLLCCFWTENVLAACAPVRFAYVDKHYPPYWLGNGAEVPEHPGAGAELVRMFAASAQCKASLVRLPTLRIPAELAVGAVDFAPVGLVSLDLPGIVFPHDKNARLDMDRSLPMLLVVFVRADDGLAHDLNPGSYFHDHLLAIAFGSGYLARLRQSGVKVDNGAPGLEQNIEKLKLHRVDGVAVTVLAPGDMDNYVAANYGADIIRLELPLYSDHVWLAASQQYYDQHPARVEAMWTWLASKGKTELAKLLKKYGGEP